MKHREKEALIKRMYQKISKCFYLFSFFFCFVAMFERCKMKEKFAYIVPDLDSTISVKKISIDNLVKQYKSLHGQYVETEGTFFSGFEEFAIYTDKKIFSKDR